MTPLAINQGPTPLSILENYPTSASWTILYYYYYKKKTTYDTFFPHRHDAVAHPDGPRAQLVRERDVRGQPVADNGNLRAAGDAALGPGGEPGEHVARAGGRGFAGRVAQDGHPGGGGGEGGLEGGGEGGGRVVGREAGGVGDDEEGGGWRKGRFEGGEFFLG